MSTLRLKERNDLRPRKESGWKVGRGRVPWAAKDLTPRASLKRGGPQARARQPGLGGRGA